MSSISMEIRGANQLEAPKLHVHSIVSVSICVDFSLYSYGSGPHDPARILLGVGYGDLTITGQPSGRVVRVHWAQLSVAASSSWHYVH